MNTLFRKYRLVLALTAGFLVLALQFSGASSAFARGVAAGGLAGSFFANNSCGTLPHGRCNWAGNEALGSTDYYTVATVEFKVPNISGQVDDHISFWTGLGGDTVYASSSPELVQAGVDSYINSSGGQANYAWYEYVGSGGSVGQQHITIPGGLHPGDKIKVTVYSNYLGRGLDSFYFTNETTGQSPTPVRITAPLSDGTTGECIGERITTVDASGNTSLVPLAKFGTEWLNDCQITNFDGVTKQVGTGGWPTNWVHIVDSNGNILVSVGATSTDGSGSFPLTWQART